MNHQKKEIKHFFPIILIVILTLLAYWFGFTRCLTRENFQMVHKMAMEFVAKHPHLSPILFTTIYIAYVALALPGILLLTILGGLIFPQPLSTLYVVGSATIGGAILFSSTKIAAEAFPNRNNRYYFNKMEKGFQKNGAAYLLLLRLIPLFPYWMVNIATAYFGVRLTTFLWTTCLGIIPCVFLVTEMGTSLIYMIESDSPWTWRSLLFHWLHS